MSWMAEGSSRVVDRPGGTTGGNELVVVKPNRQEGATAANDEAVSL